MNQKYSLLMQVIELIEIHHGVCNKEQNQADVKQMCTDEMGHWDLTQL